MSYEVFIMKNCDTCHKLVDTMQEKGIEFIQYDLTGGDRKERVEGKKLLGLYAKEGVNFETVNGLTDIPVLMFYPNGKPEDIKKAVEAVKIFQGKNAVGGLETCLSIR